MRFALAGVLMAMAVGYTVQVSAQTVALDTDKKKFSYTVGFQIGQSLKNDGLDIDVEVLSQAIGDVMKGTASRLTAEQMQAAIQSYQAKLAEQREAKGAENLKAGQAFLAQNKKKPGVIETASGLQYQVVKDGAGKKPSDDDTVVVNYRGTLINGTEFDSSYQRGEPVTFPVSGVIQGWREVLPLMKVGSTWKVFIPSDLAYGSRGAGQEIAPNSTLVFDIELLSIEDKAPQP